MIIAKAYNVRKSHRSHLLLYIPKQVILGEWWLLVPAIGLEFFLKGVHQCFRCFLGRMFLKSPRLDVKHYTDINNCSLIGFSFTRILDYLVILNVVSFTVIRRFITYPAVPSHYRGPTALSPERKNILFRHIFLHILL